MSKDPAFPFYAQDFLTGVMHFNMAERGIYITLLAYQWSHGKIPKKRLGFILGYDWEQHWDIVRFKFIDLDDDFVINERLEEEREKRAVFKEKQRINGLKGGRKPKINPDKNQIETQTHSQKKPLENESEYEYEKEKEEENKNEKFNFKKSLINFGFRENLIEDWLKVRKTKKATNTETAFKKFINQVELSGMDVNEILEICVAKSWSGFEAEWLKKENYSAQKEKEDDPIIAGRMRKSGFEESMSNWVMPNK